MRLLGIFLVVLSMFLFPVTYACFKEASPYLPNTLIVFFSSLGSWIILLPFALKQPLKTDKLGLISLRTLFGLGSMMLITLALKTTNIAETVLLNNAAPLFVPLIVWIWHRTRIPNLLWISLLIGFLGIFIVIRPGFAAVHIGTLFAFLSGITSALLLVAARQIAHEPFVRVLFYYFLLFALLLSPFLFTSWQNPPLFIWGLIALSSISQLLAQLSFTAGLRHVSSHDAAPFIYSSVVFSGLIDWAVWHKTPSLITLIGMAVVCFAAALSIMLSSKPKENK